MERDVARSLVMTARTRAGENEQGRRLVEIVAGHNSAGGPVLEAVLADPCGPSRFRLASSPGLALGAAAGDEIELREDGTFNVVARGGQLAVQLLATKPFDDAAVHALTAQLAALGGYLDGGHLTLRIFTVPVSAGFAAVEVVMDAFVARHCGTEWYFGNVYDPVDGVTPLGWWTE
jgi:Domain of unknown function (DUF4265)